MESSSSNTNSHGMFSIENLLNHSSTTSTSTTEFKGKIIAIVAADYKVRNNDSRYFNVFTFHV